MAKFDYQRRAEVDRLRRNGTDQINDYGLPRGLTPPRKRQSKADARAELEALLAVHAGKEKARRP